MPKRRTLSDGSTIILPDMKITRRLDALSEYTANRIIEGCLVSPFTLTAGGVASTTNDALNLTAGSLRMNNQYKYVPAATFTIPSMGTTRFATIYVPSTGNATVIPSIQIAPTHASAWCPDKNAQPGGSYTIDSAHILFAHISRDGASSGVISASYINNNVRPSLFFNSDAWQKDNFTDVDNSVNILELGF